MLLWYISQDYNQHSRCMACINVCKRQHTRTTIKNFISTNKDTHFSIYSCLQIGIQKLLLSRYQEPSQFVKSKPVSRMLLTKSDTTDHKQVLILELDTDNNCHLLTTVHMLVMDLLKHQSTNHSWNKIAKFCQITVKTTKVNLS